MNENKAESKGEKSMYETLEVFNSNGYDLKDVLKSCIYKYYMANKQNTFSSSGFDKKNNDSIIEATNKVEVLSGERS